MTDYKFPKTTAIIAQPRSGSTFLIRLLRIACNVHCVGDRPYGVYKSAIHLYNSMNSDSHRFTYYDDLMGELEGNLVFCDSYTDYFDEDNMKKHMSRLIWSILNSAECYTGGEDHAFKSTAFGWNPKLPVSPFVEMLRDTFEEIDIVWLVRDHKEIAESFITTEGTPLYGQENMREVVEGMAKRQLDEFNKNRDIMERMISYKGLCENTRDTLKSIVGNKGYVNEDIIGKIKENKIRNHEP